ncbi:carbohydrate kinase family protein [Methanoregula sp.]|uniref:carbohydrate kinase family protein n=1 Tax=Methanoregula sp. TaxID=2052170 RepID=UPI0026256F58|nr:carbohydrate kinase family protein [Methanoregula sp.]MDD5143524.1 carbohydrate kinase family protein [Methanoregula sp.]
MIHIVGHTAIDHISKVAHLPEKNCSTHITDRQVYYGGGAANIAAGIAVLGEKVTLHSCVGSDFAGSDYDRWMARIGVGQQFFVIPDAHTPTAFMFTDEAGDQMTFFEWGASRAFRTAEAPALPLVHMATADPEFNCRVADRSEFVSFDPGQDVFWYNKEQLDSIISNADILFANQHEVRQMCETLGITRDALIARVGMAIFTMSGDGSTLYTKGSEHFIPVVPVSLEDPTGAGDSYRAGFLSAFVRGYDPLTCCKIGTVTASHVVEHVGCQTHLPTWEAMQERYRRNFGDLAAPEH